MTKMSLFGPPVPPALPERVRKSIDDLQRHSEILIGWTQFALVMFFMLFYTISPKTSAGTPFTPVPYALAAYFVITIGRLYLAYRGALPRWVLLASVVIDVGLLLALIWSFHLQYGQPAPFYLKAPTLLYVFIFIALRSLRFEPTYVIAAGVTAAAGWLVLLWYAIDVMAPENVITRDYVVYLTTNRVLIGAEVDKIVSILLVTAILAVALIRARRMLMRAVADATVARDLTRFVAPEIASHISSTDRDIQPGDGTLKMASVVFCDIEGFSTLSERLSPAEMMVILNQYFAAVQEIIDQHQGVITQIQGDALLITFNAAHPNDRHARDALATALAIQAMLAERRFGDGVRLRVRCGVNTGELLIGAVGSSERLIFTVYGDEVNVAARLEQLNKRFATTVLTTGHTLAAAEGVFATRTLGRLHVRGRAAPVEVFAVEPETADAPVLSAPAADG